jgi:2-haloacid dehalogenase
VTIEAVVFDVGKVLYQWDLTLLLRKVESDPERLDELVNEVVTVEWHGQHDAGVPLAEMVPARIAEYPHHEAALRAYATRFNETIPGPVPGSHELVARLDARGVPIYGITNFGAEFWAGFRPTAPVFGVFRDIVVSGEERLAKPDPAIFALAQRRFGHAPAAMLFIDDSLANVESARACGWQVHHFTDAVRLADDFTRRGLI